MIKTENRASFSQRIRKFIWRNTGDVYYLKQKLTNDELESWKGKKVIFIISTGRTGTKFFAKFFQDNFKNLFSLHEPWLDIFPVALDYFRGNINYEKARILFDYYRIKILKGMNKNGVDTYIESNPRLAFMIPVIKDIAEDCKLVHIVRNGKDFVRSSYSGVTHNKGKKIKSRTKEDIKNRLTANDFKDDPYYNKWEEMSRFEKNCWFWQKKDKIIHKELQNINNSQMFYFENLFKGENIEDEWNKLINFMNIEDYMKYGMSIEDYKNNNKENRNEYYELGKWQEWPEEYKETFKKIAGEHMKTLGYEI